MFTSKELSRARSIQKEGFLEAWINPEEYIKALLKIPDCDSRHSPLTSCCRMTWQCQVCHSLIFVRPNGTVKSFTSPRGIRESAFATESVSRRRIEGIEKAGTAENAAY